MTTEWWWLSSEAMTVGVTTESRVIVRASPIVRRFIGQPLENLVRWMRGQGGFRMERL